MSAATAPVLTVTGFEAIVMFVLSALYLTLWRRTREPGMGSLSVGFALAATWYGLSDRISYTGPYLDTADQRVGGVVIALAVVMITRGVVQYLGFPRGRLRALVMACWTSALVSTAVVALTPVMPHRVFHVTVLVAYVGAAAVAFRRASQRPGEGHLLLGLALTSLPLAPPFMALLDTPPPQLKYFAGVSVAVFGVLLLVVSLLRRQRWLRIEVERRASAEQALRDVNARLEARVQERTAHLNELIAGLEAFNRSVSHDLRGPLGGMAHLSRMAADALARGDTTVAERGLPLIAAQCQASADMVSSVLELARLSDVPVRRETACLSQLARTALDEVMLGQPGRSPPALLLGDMPLVSVDTRLLRAVFVNLLGNAVKFTAPIQTPRVDVQARRQGRDVVITVSDNGVGFDAGLAERLFEPFYRASDNRFAGHGLGLSIVRRAVEAMGGSVAASASEAGGASFRIVLPDAAVPDGEAPARPSVEAPAPALAAQAVA